jgi:hypothetical protein
VWFDLLLLLVLVFPLLSWSAMRVRRSPSPLNEASELSTKLPSSEFQEAPEAPPHQAQEP